MSNLLTSEVVKLEQVETHLCSRRSYNQLFYLRQTAYRWLTQSNFPLCGVNFVHRRKDLQVEHDGIAAERIQATEEFCSEEDIALDPWLLDILGCVPLVSGCAELCSITLHKTHKSFEKCFVSAGLWQLRRLSVRALVSSNPQ